MARESTTPLPLPEPSAAPQAAAGERPSLNESLDELARLSDQLIDQLTETPGSQASIADGMAAAIESDLDAIFSELESPAAGPTAAPVGPLSGHAAPAPAPQEVLAVLHHLETPPRSETEAPWESIEPSVVADAPAVPRPRTSPFAPEELPASAGPGWARRWLVAAVLVAAAGLGGALLLRGRGAAETSPSHDTPRVAPTAAATGHAQTAPRVPAAPAEQRRSTIEQTPLQAHGGAQTVAPPPTSHQPEETSAPPFDPGTTKTTTPVQSASSAEGRNTLRTTMQEAPPPTTHSSSASVRAPHAPSASGSEPTARPAGRSIPEPRAAVHPASAAPVVATKPVPVEVTPPALPPSPGPSPKDTPVSLVPPPAVAAGAPHQEPVAAAPAEPAPSIDTPDAPQIEYHLETSAPATAPATAPAAAPVPQAAAPAPSKPPLPIYEPPRSILRAEPVYPAESRAQGEGGTLILRLLISETGSVERAVIETGIPGSKLEAAAIEAALHWTYEPAQQSGRPVRAWVTERVVFTP